MPSNDPTQREALSGEERQKRIEEARHLVSEFDKWEPEFAGRYCEALENTLLELDRREQEHHEKLRQAKEEGWDECAAYCDGWLELPKRGETAMANPHRAPSTSPDPSHV